MFFHEKMYGEDYKSVVEMCNLKEGDVFIDIGANLGQEIEFFGNMGIKMYSYEPHPHIYEFLTEKFDHLENVFLSNKAVSNKNEKTTLFHKEDNIDSRRKIGHIMHRPGHEWHGLVCNDIGSSIIPGKNSGEWSSTVDCVDIAEVIRSILEKEGSIKVLKIDAEGAEYKILNRMIQEKILDAPEFIFFEPHERKISNSEFLKDLAFFKSNVPNNINFYQW